MSKFAAVDYLLLMQQLESMLANERDPLANSANFVGLLYNEISDINWLGLYILREQELVLGPFQGQPACVRISLGQGVCGTAAEKRQTLRVADVQSFDGHIACDAASRSEIVVPLITAERLLGVLDIDSPELDRFEPADQDGIEQLCAVFVQALERETLTLPDFI
jgi:GAF domain-containing protein